MSHIKHAFLDTLTTRNDDQLTAVDGLTPTAPVAPQSTIEKQITYDRETLDYLMEYRDGSDAPWQLVGYARTHSDAENTLDAVIYEILRRTTIETADIAAEVAAATDDTPPAATARSIALAAGCHELDDRDLQDAYVQALAHPEMQTARWQNALNKAYDHLLSYRGVVSISADGGYLWWADDDKGGDYVATPSACQCIAFGKDQPCRHRAVAIIVSFYDADTFRFVFRGLLEREAA